MSRSINAAARHIEDLGEKYQEVLRCVSEGLSNEQIVKRLGYKNTATVGQIIHLISSKIGLVDIKSRIEKRKLLGDAYRTFSGKVISVAIPSVADLLNSGDVPLDETALRRL